VLTHAERSFRVSGRVASFFCLSAAVGELVMPLCVALLYVHSHTAFPRAVLAASCAQALAFVLARRSVSWLRAHTEGPTTLSRGEGEGEGPSIAAPAASLTSLQVQPVEQEHRAPRDGGARMRYGSYSPAVLSTGTSDRISERFVSL
jgi:hypothetical protein